MSPEIRHELAIDPPHCRYQSDLRVAQDEHVQRIKATHGVDVILAPAAQAVQNGPARLLERLGHFIVAVKRDKRRPHASHVVAVVVLEVVDAPGCEALGVLRLVVERSRYSPAASASRTPWSATRLARLTVSRAGHLAGARVHAE